MEQFSYSERMRLVERDHQLLSVRKQCNILGINRSSLYYKARPENPFNIAIQDAVRFVYSKYPFYGHRRTTKQLKRMGFKVGLRRVRRIRNDLGLRTIYPKPNLSKPRQEHRKYPYLLKGLNIDHPDMVWGTDITYVRIKQKGWVYVVAIIDWFSRYILSYEVSISMEVDFCLAALEDALQRSTPEIFNSDQGSQFTSNEFLNILEKKKKIRISMDSKGRALDNVRTERFWRSLKYEHVFLTEYTTVQQARREIGGYIEFYNHERIHQSLNYYTPHEIYFGIEDINIKKW